MVGKLHDDIKALERRLDELDNDPIMRMAASNYKAVIRKARAQTRARSIAAAKEKDPFWRAQLQLQSSCDLGKSL